MAPSSLKLFPSPSRSLPPRESSLKQSQAQRRKGSSVEATAAVQVNPQGVGKPIVKPAADTYKHTLFCNPSSNTQLSPTTQLSNSPSSDLSSRGTLRRHARTRRQSSQIYGNPISEAEGSSLSSVDQLRLQTEIPRSGSPSLRNGHISTFHKLSLSSSLQDGAASIQLDQANRSLSPVYTKDGLSPVPENAVRWQPPSSDLVRKSSTVSRPIIPSLSHSSSTLKKPVTDCPPYSLPVQSIFPQYDHSKPVNQQNYYPTIRAPSPITGHSDHLSRSSASPSDRQVLKHHDSAIGLVDGYEHIPAAGQADIEMLWKASREEFPVAGRKVQFALSTGSGLALAIGTSPENVIYSMDRDVQQHNPRYDKHVSVKKHSPKPTSSSLVAQLKLQDRRERNNTTKDITSIFPHQAAIDAISSVSDSPKAREIASLDPAGKSDQAADLARDAVAEAHRRYKCNLVRRTRKRDSLGTVIASYDLCHPRLGKCAMTVTKSLSPTSISGPRAKISLHHPSATPAAVASDTLNLAFLDFARDACVLDIPGLLALDSHYVIDTVLSALLAVAVVENDALVTETMAFEAPPKAPIGKKSKANADRRISGTGSTRSGRFFRRSGKKKEQQALEPVGEQVELPILTQGALTVISLSFKTAVWVLGAGVKVTTGLVMGADHLAKKL